MKKKRASKLKIRGRASPAVENATEESRKRTIEEVFDNIERFRQRVKPLPKGLTIKDLIEDGRT
jgi:hypothetical protein